MKNYSDTQLRILEKSQIGCRDVIKLMGDYADQELSATLRARLDSHICACEKCQSFTATYGLTIELASELADREIPEDVQRRLRKALNQRLGLQLPMP